MASLADRMIGAMKADVKTFEEVEKDPAALGQAVTVIIIAAVASFIGSIFPQGISGALRALLAGLIGYAVWTVIVVLVGTKVMPEPSTKANFVEGFRVIGFAAAPGVFHVFGMIPILGSLISTCVLLWSLVVMVVAVKSVLDYTDVARAAIVCLIGFVIYMILYFVVLMPLLTARAVLG